MALDFKKLFQPQLLPNAVGILFTMPGTPTTTVMKNGRVTLTNTSGSAVAVTLYAVPAAGSPTATNMFLSAASLAAGASLNVDIPTLAISDSLQGFAGTAAVVNVQESGGALWS